MSVHTASAPAALERRHADGASHDYRPGLPLGGRGRLLALAAVLLAHFGGLAALLIQPEPTPIPLPVLAVRMIAEAPVVAIAPPPPPLAKPPPPVRKPTMIAAARATPAPIVMPPPEPDAPQAPSEEPLAPTDAIAEPVAEPAPPAPPAPPQVVPPSYVAAYLNNPAPVYPPSAKLRRESGEVRLRVRVTPEGRAGAVEIDRSSGSYALDNAARDVVFRKWRFVPAREGDVPIEAWVIVPIVFELHG